MGKEIILNLWAYCDARTKLINAVSAKSYEVSGSDEVKLQYLERFRNIDYKKVQRSVIPKNFNYSVDGYLENGSIHVDILKVFPMAIFEEIIVDIEQSIFPRKISENPLSIITLLCIEQGKVIRSITTKEDSEWFHQQKLGK